MKSLLIYWAPAALWAGLIFLLSSQPATDVGRYVPLKDPYLFWMAHMVEYAVLSALLCRLLMSLPIGSGKTATALAFLLAVSYGITDEIHQYYVAGRVTSTVDIAFDTAGALLGLTGMALFSAGRLRLWQWSAHRVSALTRWRK